MFCWLCDARNGYLARDQNLPRSNFFAGLKIVMEGKYDVRCECLSKMWRLIIKRKCSRCLDISFFHRIAQGVKQKNFVPFIVLFMGLWDTRNLRRDLANQAWSVEILLTSDESDKINTQDWSWNTTVDTVGLLSIVR